MPEEEKLDEILEQGSVVSPKREVVYYRPKFHRRVLANLVDILLFAFLFIGLFSLDRYIVTNTSEYKSNMKEFNQIRVDSGIFVDLENGNYEDIITHLNSDSKNNSEYKMRKAREAIEQFITYSSVVSSETDYKYIVEDYDKFRLNDKLVYKYSKATEWDGMPLFVQSGDEIIENPVLIDEHNYVPNVYNVYYSKAYAKYVDDHLQGFLSTRIPRFYDLTKYLALTLIFADIVPAYLVSGILVYYVPTLFFRRGRRTLGKALYRIGLVDSRVLSPTFARSTARFTIFYFAELVLSVVTFGLPFLISFSMMAFSKGKQGFPDYMLSLTEIDMSRTKIYKSYDEADFDQINAHKKPVDFRVPNFD